MNSIRGFLYFRAFIDNEKIKMYLFKNYLFFDLFKTIDQIKEEEESSNENSSKIIEGDNITSIEKEIKQNFETNSDKKNKLTSSVAKRSKSEVIKRDSELVEMDSKSKQTLPKASLINDEEEDSEDSDDSDDETKKITNETKT